MGFKVCANDNCLLKRESKDGTVFICLYVDDLMCTGDKEAVMKAVADIQKQYVIKINEEKSDSEFIGVTYEKIGEDIVISQPNTIKKLDKDFWTRSRIDEEFCLTSWSRRTYRAQQRRRSNQTRTTKKIPICSRNPFVVDETFSSRHL